MTPVDTQEVVRLAAIVVSSGVSAGAASWFGLKYRLNGIEDRITDRFNTVDRDIGNIDRKVDKINGKVGRHESDIAVLKDRSERPG